MILYTLYDQNIFIILPSFRYACGEPLKSQAQIKKLLQTRSEQRIGSAKLFEDLIG